MSWGPEQDQGTKEALQAVLEFEAPDLVVFSGDQVMSLSLHSQTPLPSNLRSAWRLLSVLPSALVRDMGRSLPLIRLRLPRCTKGLHHGALPSTRR